MNQKLIIFIGLLLLLSGCSGERCIDADDFGHAKFNISARYDEDEFTFDQVGADQVGPWRDSNFRVNGRPLVIMVKNWEPPVDRNVPSELSAWCAWYGAFAEGTRLSDICERVQDCVFSGGMCPSAGGELRILNAPCLFRKGIGLYALIAAKDSDPNLTIQSQRDPNGINFHLGEPSSGYKMFDIAKDGSLKEAGGRSFTYSSVQEKREYANSKLYFKILDNFYDDNSGQYRVVIKSGVSGGDPDPIAYVTNLVKTFLFGVDNDYGLIRNIYRGVVEQSSYKAAVSGLLTLYVIFTALSYLVGSIKITNTELIVRVSKIAIISALLNSEYSWTFFNDFLFVYFVGGVEQILQMIMEAGSTGPGSPSIVALLLAPQTMSKLLALLFVDWRGFIYIILFVIALYFVLVVFFEAAVIYLVALISIGMLIVMGPIFICFMLFGITRSLFENWLKQLISFAIQPIILFTGLIFISAILRQEIYNSLGFRICKQSFPQANVVSSGEITLDELTEDIAGFSIGDSLFYWWFPHPMKARGFHLEEKDLVEIPIPIDHFASDGEVGDISSDGFCQAYGCMGKRFADLPFLDPQKDKERLEQFRNGQYVQLEGLLLIFVAIYLLSKFNGLAVSTARFLTGTSGNSSNISNVGSDVRDGRMAATAWTKNKLTPIGRGFVDRSVGWGNEAKGRSIREGLQRQFTGAVSAIKTAPSRFVDKARVNKLMNEALKRNGEANPAVLEEVKRATGLSQKDVKSNAVKGYQDALKKELKSIDPKLSEAQLAKLSTQMSGKKPASIENELAKAKYGKTLAELSKPQKEDIEAIYKRVNPGAQEAERAKQFKKAYVDAYQALSERGIGVVGKHSRAIRSVEEIKARADKNKELKDEKRRNTGEQIYGKFAEVKNTVARGVIGEKYRVPGIDGSEFAGINLNPTARNYTKQTYNEQLADQGSEIKRQDLAKTIESLNRKYKDNVTSPEFLARAEKNKDPNFDKFKNLAKEDLSYVVQKNLSGGEDPALMGQTYMSKYAKDSEMRHMIDRAHEIEQQIVQSDEFISREALYESKFDTAAEGVKSVYDELKLTPEVSVDTAIAKFESHIASDIADNNISSSQEIADKKARVEKFKQDLNDFYETQEMLQKIDERKVAIGEEVESHIGKINEHRTNNGMEKYDPPSPKIRTRTVRKIEDHLRKK